MFLKLTVIGLVFLVLMDSLGFEESCLPALDPPTLEQSRLTLVALIRLCSISEMDELPPTDGRSTELELKTPRSPFSEWPVIAAELTETFLTILSL